MKESKGNPFDITKAVDFTDQQIKDYWVEMPGSYTFRDMAKPRSAVPMIILGGKGSGKTHLMRYFSYQIQRIIHANDVVSGIEEDGYLGIYLSCGGLNASRFSGKGIPSETWNAAYAYYMDLWLTRLTLSIINDAFRGSSEKAEHESVVCEEVVSLFDKVEFEIPTKIDILLERLAGMQKELDIQINNCAITNSLEIRINASPGRLVFGVPQVLEKRIPSLRKVAFIYLIDEFENLSEEQQKYVNTLVRERQSPTSIKIGARLYGIKTLKTFSDNEENKEGSEFEYLRLDELLRSNESQYSRFAKQLVARRLYENGYLNLDCEQHDAVDKYLTESFQVVEPSKYREKETRFVIDKYGREERPYFKTLRRKLNEGLQTCSVSGLQENDIDQIIENLSAPEYPLLEKVSIYLFYKDWSNGRELRASSIAIRKLLSVYLDEPRQAPQFKTAYDHFQSDLMAQLMRECDQKQQYLGIDTFIDISQGLPRNLLVILKNIFKWAVFNGEVPFRGQPVSMTAQREGLNEAAEWFYNDARAPGGDGKEIRDGIERLSTLFRDIRFSDKPSECSLLSFSTDSSRVSEQARRVIERARQWSLLIYVGEQRNRNSRRVDPKFELNRMIAPLKDLPISRRGTIDLSYAEVDAIFHPKDQSEYESVLKTRKERMMAPFGVRKRRRTSHKQGALFKELR